MNWKEELQFEVLEDYLMDAKLTEHSRDPKEHMEVMRGHFKKLQDFIEKTIKHSQQQLLEEVMVIINKAEDEDNLWSIGEQVKALIQSKKLSL